MRTRSSDGASSRTGYWRELLMCDPAGARIIDSWPLTPTPQASRTRRSFTAAAVAGTKSSQTHRLAVRSRSAPSGPAHLPPPRVRRPPQTPARPPRLPPPPRDSSGERWSSELSLPRTSALTRVRTLVALPTSATATERSPLARIVFSGMALPARRARHVILHSATGTALSAAAAAIVVAVFGVASWVATMIVVGVVAVVVVLAAAYVLSRP
jgi:hypothetical protein